MQSIVPPEGVSTLK